MISTRNSLIALAGILIACIMCSCTRQSQGPAHSVVVIHSYNDEGEEGEPFRKAMVQAFGKHNLRVNAHHVYLNLVHRTPEQVNEEIFPQYRDSIETLWQPEVILLNDDPAYHYALNHNQDAIFKHYPVVYSGVNALLPQSQAQYPNFTGFEDRIDLEENCEILNSMIPGSVIHIDLDLKNAHDRQLYGLFHGQIKENKRFEILRNSQSLPRKGNDDDGGNICLNFISSLESQQQLSIAYDWSFLNVKYDIMSNTFIDLNSVPDFTAIREGFNNPMALRFLGGYFTSMQTQVEDQVDYAVQIMKGSSPESLPLSEHKKGYYIDFNAIKLLEASNTTLQKDISYQSLKDFFQIVNVPQEVANPILYKVAILACILLGALVLVGCMSLWFSHRKAQIKMLENERKQKNKLKAQVLASTHSTVWRVANQKFELPLEFTEHRHLPKKIPLETMKRNLIHPSTRTLWDEFENFKQDFGWQKKRICFTFNKGKSWHWYYLIYNVTPESISKGELMGLFINADNQIEREKKLKEALEKAQEVNLKEHFLENISSSLEAPLQLVCTNAMLLADTSVSMERSEKQVLKEKVNKGIAELLKIIDSVVQHAHTIKMLVLLFGIASLLTGCKHETRNTVKVLLVHQYSETLQGYQEFHESLQKEFYDEGYELERRDIYLNLKGRNSDAQHILQHLSDSEDPDWKADVIMAEGDRSMNFTFKLFNDSEAPYPNDVPVVFGGIESPDWEILKNFPNITVISDGQDLGKNINLAYEFTHTNSVMVELDYFPEDLVLRRRLKRILAQPPYVDNSDFHLPSITPTQLQEEMWDSLVVQVISVYNMELNNSVQMERQEALDTLSRIYTMAELFPQLVVKKDLYGEMLANKTSKPQFTTRRELFADGRGNYLAGYFADYATVGKDMAKTAINQLRGQKNLAGSRTHAKHYYLDYEAAQKVGLNHQRYTNTFELKNQPKTTQDLDLYWVIVGGAVLLAVTIVITLQRKALKKQRRMEERLRTLLDDDRKLNLITQQGTRNIYVTSVQEMKKVIEKINPDHTEQKEEIRQTLDVPGNYAYRIQAAIADDGHMDWWRLRYAVDRDKNNQMLLEGLLLNINESIEQEEELRKAERLEEETRKKENFLVKITHEIRTPLNAIQGFTDILMEYGDDMAESEREEISQDVLRGIDGIHKIVTDVIMYSHAASEATHIHPERINVGDFVDNMLKRHEKWLTRNQVQAVIIKGREGLFIEADMEKLTAAYRQLIDNARKFTQHQTIVVGWEYKINTNEVEIFVEDSGVGIPAEKIPALFSLFWKNDSFVPGIGIGLNIAESYVHAMNGKLEVETEEGVGSRFMMVFPVC